MTYYSRLKESFEGALRLPLNPKTKYVLFSDCHRGVGNANDNFLKNRTLYLAALKYYYRSHYTYIELGDGDELWENRDLNRILDTHSDVFSLLSCFQERGQLYLLYGNHDIEKKTKTYTTSNSPGESLLASDISYHAGIILESCCHPDAKDIYITHGHQADMLNSTFWRLSRFLVRHVWKPLERYGIPDPTSAAKNYKRKEKTERRLHDFAKRENHLLIAGHTHRPFLSETDLYYCNSGSCVHPYSITCLEIEQMHISLIKWSLSARPDMSLYVDREVLSGPIPLYKEKFA